MGDGGPAAASLLPDADGRADGDGRAEDAQPWETGGQPRRHSCLMLMVELMEMVELKDVQPWETGASRGVTPA